MLSPAKINLGLEVLHRRQSDGYHLINSIFIPISYGDDLEISHDYEAGQHILTTENLLPEARRRDFEKVSERGDLSGNLIWKILVDASEFLGGARIKIHMTKRLPTGAGLGGGSSNAGLTLSYIRDRLGASPETIFRLALKHGADIPFFLHSAPMVVRGIGELMEEIDVGPGLGVLATPPVMVNTALAYQDLKRPLQEDLPQKSWSLLDGGIRQALVRSDWSKLHVLTNDFEKVVFARYPKLDAVKAAFLRHGAAYASLSGSGSAVYGLLSANQGKEGQALLLEQMRASFTDAGYEFTPFQF